MDPAGCCLIPSRFSIAKSDADHPWPLFVLYLAAVATVAGWAVARHREATREQAVVVVLGAGTAQAVLAVVAGVLIGNIIWAASSVLFTAVFVTALVRIRRKERRSLTAELRTSDVQ
jgi:FtsH-binding integral membrane protein